MAELKSNTPKNVRVEYSNVAVVNIGNFQNLQPGVKISADVPDGVNPKEVYAKLEALVDSLLDAKVQAIHKELADQ